MSGVCYTQYTVVHLLLSKLSQSFIFIIIIICVARVSWMKRRTIVPCHVVVAAATPPLCNRSLFRQRRPPTDRRARTNPDKSRTEAYACAAHTKSQTQTSFGERTHTQINSHSPKPDARLRQIRIHNYVHTYAVVFPELFVLSITAFSPATRRTATSPPTDAFFFIAIILFRSRRRVIPSFFFF